MSCLLKPSALSRSKPGSSIFSAAIFRAPVRKSAPSVHLLKTNLMSNALASADSTLASAASVKPLVRSVAALTPGA